METEQTWTTTTEEQLPRRRIMDVHGIFGFSHQQEFKLPFYNQDNNQKPQHVYDKTAKGLNPLDLVKGRLWDLRIARQDYKFRKRTWEPENDLN
ncbi:hypothetical protein G7Z17_g8399 [Cylindrodendrum hubeiense]|uniref:Uncharacterized protein n=1 Tax=Cylindrodendrum hubeiense TaxID=595255 RepID=A0A9P5LED4_9HYPO|nr:hypothetical protein G7Z17_g8399 [Cylindrodendrum hubeiense]